MLGFINYFMQSIFMSQQISSQRYVKCKAIQFYVEDIPLCCKIERQ